MPHTAGRSSARSTSVLAGNSGATSNAPGALPRERLTVVADGIAVPLEDAEEVKLDVGVRIDEPLHQPRRGAPDADAELLGELAFERVARRLARLELAAGKLPITGVRLPRRALREQHAAVGAHDDRGGDGNDALGH